MIIEVNLNELSDAPDYGTALAVALLSALPQDAAELAVAQWRAVLAVRDKADADELDAASIYETYDQAEEPETRLDITAPAERRYSAGTPLEHALSAKTANALRHAGFQVLGDLEVSSGDWLVKTVDRFGKGALAEVEAVMAKAGLSLSQKAGVSHRPAEPEQDSSGNGADAMPLRDLVRKAEHEAGRQTVWQVFQKHGATKLRDITPDIEPAFRADLAEALS